MEDSQQAEESGVRFEEVFRRLKTGFLFMVCEVDCIVSCIIVEWYHCTREWVVESGRLWSPIIVGKLATLRFSGLLFGIEVFTRQGSKHGRLAASQRVGCAFQGGKVVETGFLFVIF